MIRRLAWPTGPGFRIYRTTPAGTTALAVERTVAARQMRQPVVRRGQAAAQCPRAFRLLTGRGTRWNSRIGCRPQAVLSWPGGAVGGLGGDGWRRGPGRAGGSLSWGLCFLAAGAVRVLWWASRAPGGSVAGALLVVSLDLDGLSQVGGPLDGQVAGLVGRAGFWDLSRHPPRTALP